MLALASALAATTTAAIAHETGTPVPLGPPVPPSMPLADPGAAGAMDAVRTAHAQQVFAERLEHAPREVDGICTATTDFRDVGPGCRTDDGLLRVNLPGGGSAVTHGPDFALGSASTDPATIPPRMVAAIRAASKADVACVPASEPHTALVYAIPADGEDRASLTVPAFRERVYEVSAIIDAESRSLAPTAGRRLRVRCDGSGVPVVTQLRLPTTTSDASFATVVNDVLAQMTLLPYSSGARPLVFYDAHLSDQFAGIAQINYDDAASRSNTSNEGGRVALEDNSEGRGPSWETLLHELGHNMGAVQPNVPDSNEVSHCNDGLDVMCYAEPATAGVQGTYVDDQCAQLQLDCDHDTYFHPAPTGGTSLATSWNVAATYNAYLEPYVAPVDIAAPTAPSGLAAQGHGAFVRLTWNAASDGGSGVAGYRVARKVSGSWVPVADSWPGDLAVDATWPGIAPATSVELRVTAFDRRGNEGTGATVSTTTGSTSGVLRVAGGPMIPAPTDLRATDRTASTLTLAWNSPPADAMTYSKLELYNATCDCSWWRTTYGSPATFTGLPAGERFEVRAQTHDGIRWQEHSTARTSAMTMIHAWTAGTSSSIGAPASVAVTSSDRVAPRLEWDAVPGATTYVVSRQDGGSWQRLATTSLTNVVPPGLAYGATHVLGVVAVDERGAESTRTTTTFVAPAAPDRTAPSVPVDKGVWSLSTSSLRVEWDGATDGVGVVGYRVAIATSTDAANYTLVADVGSAARSQVLTGLTAATTYRVRVFAYDAAGNVSSTYNYRYNTTLTDDQAPTAPSGLVASAVARDGVTLDWNAATDNVGVARYMVFVWIDGAWVVADANVSATTYRVTGLTPETNYWFSVVAYDAAGNPSVASNQVNATTGAAPPPPDPDPTPTPDPAPVPSVTTPADTTAAPIPPVAPIAPVTPDPGPGGGGDDHGIRATQPAPVVAPPANQVAFVGTSQLATSARTGSLILRFPVTSAGTTAKVDVRVTVAIARKLGLRVPKGAKFVSIGSASRVVTTPGQATLVVKFTGPARAALKRAVARRTLRKVPVSIVVGVIANGTSASVTRAATLS